MNKVLQAQLFIQHNLDKALSLASVADEVKLSYSHFHRAFKKQTGETLHAYITRLKTARAYYDIRLTDHSILEIAQRWGFKNPETFSRMFKKHQGKNPSEVPRLQANNKKNTLQQFTRAETLNGLLDKSNINFQLTYLNNFSVVYEQHIGPYEKVPLVSTKNSSWCRLSKQIVGQSSHIQGPVYIGMPLDSPLITPPEKLRYDMCVLINNQTIKTPAMKLKKIKCGYYAVLNHAGPYNTLSKSYNKLFELSSQLVNYNISSAPMFELLLDVDAKTPTDHSWTSLYLPLKKVNFSST